MRRVQRLRVVADDRATGGRVFLDGVDISNLVESLEIRMGGRELNRVWLSVFPGALEIDGGFVVTADGAEPRVSS